MKVIWRALLSSAVVVEGNRVGGGEGLAGEDVAGREFGVLEREVAAHRDLALRQQRAAGAADAALAGERQVGAGTLGAVEDGG